MTGRGRKDKGKRYERHIADTIKDKFGGDAHRTPNSGAMGNYVPDFRGDIMYLPTALEGFLIECKHQERLEIWRFIDQMEREAKDDKIPLLVFTKNNKNDYVCLSWSAFMEILYQLKKQEIDHVVDKG